MPFNSSGVFQRLFNWRTDRDAGINILAERVDQETDGLASAINDIVENEVSWKAPTKNVNGTEALPTYSFAEDTDTGVYRPSPNTLGMAVGGSKKVEIDEEGMEIAGTTSVNDLTATGTTSVNDLTATGTTSVNDLTATGTTSVNDLTATGTTSVNDLTATGATSVNDLTATGATSVNDLTGAGVERITPFQSIRSFTHGTLVTTDIDVSVGSDYDYFSMQIIGNNYVVPYLPFSVLLGGSHANNRFYNISAISTGSHFSSSIKILKNANGKLCFWLSREVFGQAFSVSVYKVGDEQAIPLNHVISITDESEPASDVKVISPVAPIYAHGTLKVDLTSSRQLDVNYTNTTEKIIRVAVRPSSVNDDNGVGTFYVDNQKVSVFSGYVYTGGSTLPFDTHFVLPNQNYRVTTTTPNSNTFEWWEWR